MATDRSTRVTGSVMIEADTPAAEGVVAVFATDEHPRRTQRAASALRSLATARAASAT